MIIKTNIARIIDLRDADIYNGVLFNTETGEFFGGRHANDWLPIEDGVFGYFLSNKRITNKDVKYYWDEYFNRKTETII